MLLNGETKGSKRNNHNTTTADEAIALLTEAQVATDDSVSLYEFIRTLHASLSAEERLKVIELLWQLALSDKILNKYENEKKFCSYVIKSAQENHAISCKNPQLELDFLHVMDIAKAFKVILLNDFTGTINISSGNSISLKDIAQYILKKLKKEKLLELKSNNVKRLIDDGIYKPGLFD